MRVSGDRSNQRLTRDDNRMPIESGKSDDEEDEEDEEDDDEDDRSHKAHVSNTSAPLPQGEPIPVSCPRFFPPFLLHYFLPARSCGTRQCLRAVLRRTIRFD